MRDIIGRNDLSTVLSQRRELDEQLTVILDEQTEPWGIKVQSVQLRDIKVPDNLQDALSRMAQAERERQARVILGESEVQVAAAVRRGWRAVPRAPDRAAPARHEHAVRDDAQRAVASVIVVPSSALESMNLGAIGGLAALREVAAPMAASAASAATHGLRRATPPPPTTPTADR